VSEIKLCIPGEPVAQGRPRAYTGKDGKPRLYDPKRSKQYKDMVRVTILEAIGLPGRPIEAAYPPGVPIDVVIRAYHSCPKSDQRVRSPAPQRWRSIKPDADNVAKCILDACSGGYLWHDDAQVARLMVEHYTAAQGEAPRVTIEVNHLTGGDIEQ